MLTTFDSDENVLRALRAGASGFLLKDAPPAEIATAIRRVAAGEPILSPTDHPPPDGPRGDGGGRVRAGALRRWRALSAREHDVAVAVGKGRTNAEIAAELHVSVATVKSHITRVLTKLDAGNRTQIALLIHDAGLV